MPRVRLYDGISPSAVEEGVGALKFDNECHDQMLRLVIVDKLFGSSVDPILLRFMRLHLVGLDRSISKASDLVLPDVACCT